LFYKCTFPFFCLHSNKVWCCDWQILLAYPLKHDVLYRYEPTTDQARPFNRCQITEKLDIKQPVPVNGILVWNSQLKR
ncbi:hypothetical protein CMK16_06730, partial [Candidatus Poribacteria bacterium]|nr:hypothetical protein [Candidatus Poribacteria bacterium]